LAQEKQKYLWIINLTGAVANILLNFILIPIFGISGAAIASVLTQIIANVVIGFVLKSIRENNRLMLKSLNLSCILRVLKKHK
jgi:Na+-driven multidrug efflux pump